MHIKNANRKKLWLKNCHKINVLQTIAVVHKSIHTAHKIEIQRRTRAKTSAHTHTHPFIHSEMREKETVMTMDDQK